MGYMGWGMDNEFGYSEWTNRSSPLTTPAIIDSQELHEYGIGTPVKEATYSTLLLHKNLITHPSGT